LPFIILTAISFSASLVFAIEFSFSSPSSIAFNTSFSTSLSAETSDVYDVKIFVEESNTTTISEIYDGASWKNPFYYLKEKFPSQKEYLIRVVKNSQNPMQICARLRKTNSSSFSEKCNPIALIQGNSDGNNNQNSSSQNSSSANQQSQTNITTSNSTAQSSTPQSSDSGTNLQDNSSKKRIVLNAPKETEQQSKNSGDIFSTKEERTRLWLVYGFSFFCVFVIILLALRKL